MTATTEDAPTPTTPEARAQAGKTARRTAPRTSLAAWQPAADRSDPVTLLEQQGTTRVAELVPIRYGRMAASAFAFYRGAAKVMSADLAGMPRSPFTVQLCGDAHLANFGGFASPERRLVFDINDFDETLPGPFEWDVKRLAASFEIAGRSRAFDPATVRPIVAAAVQAYRESMRSFAQMRNLDLWYVRLDVEDMIAQWGRDAGKKTLENMQRNVEKAESKDRLKAMAKLTEMVDGELRFRSDPPLLVPIDEIFEGEDRTTVEAVVIDALARYGSTLSPDRRRLLDTYRYVAMARKVVGVGSVGTRCWVALFVGRDSGDPFFLQVKEAEASVLEPHLDPSEYDNHGQRVVEGQRLMQATPDIFLGWERNEGVDGRQHDYYMRQLWDWKASAAIDTMTPEAMTIYAKICGWTLARGHARSGDRIAIASYLGSGTVFDDAIADFAAAYADQNERDHQALVDAIASGRIEATTGI